MGKISATIITYDEEQRIEACLKSLQGVADEIIVVDSFSTDATVDICRRYGCTIVQRRFNGYGVQRQYATSLTSYSYVLSLDADEELSPALRQSLIHLKQHDFKHRVYCFSRLNFYCGEPVRHCGWYPDWQIRLFDKRYANWNLRNVQERVIFPDTLRPARVDGDILHYRCSTPEEYCRTERLHAGITAKVIAAQGHHIGPITPIVKGLEAFVSCFLRQGGILDGPEGRAICRERFNSTLSAYRMARRILNKQHSDDVQDVDK